MKIGKHKDPTSSISTANSDMIVVRGLDLCKDLIGQVSLTEHFWLLVTGKRPTRPRPAPSTPAWSPLPNTASAPACRPRA